jgi:hypothetical protein
MLLRSGLTILIQDPGSCHLLFEQIDTIPHQGSCTFFKSPTIAQKAWVVNSFVSKAELSNGPIVVIGIHFAVFFIRNVSIQGLPNQFSDELQNRVSSE